MVSGLAPGRVAVIWMVGKSILRQRRDRQLRVGDQADEQDPRHQQRGTDRKPNKGCRNSAAVHSCCTLLGAVPVLATAVVTSEPGLDLELAAVITRSPGLRP